MAEEKTYSQMRQEFYNSFQTKIIPMVQPYEAERKRTRIKASIISSILVVLGIMVLLIPLSYQDIIKEHFILALLAGILASASWDSYKKSFENRMKKKIMPIICSCFPDLKWSNGKYSDSWRFANAKVVPTFDGAESYDDIFKGVYSNIGFDIVEATYSYGSGKSRGQVFNGVIIKLDINKNFKGHTVIKSNNILGFSFLHKFPTKTLQRTLLEDVNFERKYSVFTNDPVEARYLITPAFMERLKNITLAFKSENLCCSFLNKHLYIAINTKKDLFSICSLVKPIDDAKQYNIMYEEIVSIIKLIRYFKLDQKIGL